MNEHRTCTDLDTNLTQPRSGPVRYELIDKEGCCVGSFPSARFAAAMAKTAYPNQEQDPDRTGKGWDVQVVGAGR